MQSVQGAPTELHAWVCCSAGHGIPFESPAITVLRVRVAEPESQQLVHVPQTVQLETRQFVTQIFVLHGTSSNVVSGQEFEDAHVEVMARVRLCVPEPQDAVHGNHAVQSEVVHAQLPRSHVIEPAVLGQSSPEPA